MLFSTLKNIKKCPFTYWLNGRWFLQIVDRDSGNLYPIYPLLPCSDFFNLKCGGGMHFMLFPTFLENNILGIKKKKIILEKQFFFI